MVNVPDNSIPPKTRAEWRSWLEQHHRQNKGIWLISYKKATGKPRFDYDEAVEEALCFGWIDSKPIWSRHSPPMKQQSKTLKRFQSR